MMNAIPYNLIIQTCSYTSTNCKNQFSIKCLFQKLKHLSPLGNVWQIGSSSCSWKVLTISRPSMHIIVDDDRRYVISTASEILIYIMCHFSIRLVSSHMSENSRANRAFSPLVFANELQQTYFMILVRAAQHEYVIVILFFIFFVETFDGKLLQADHTFLVLHFGFAKLKLQSRKIRDLEHIVVFFLLLIVLSVNILHDKRDEFKIIVGAVDCVLVVQIDFHLSVTGLLEVKFTLLLFLHQYKVSIAIKN